MNAELDLISEKILKMFLNHQRLTLSQLDVLVPEHSNELSLYLSLLLKQKYIKNTNFRDQETDYVKEDAAYCITIEGRSYLGVQSKINSRFRQDLYLRVLPIVISCIALIKSFWPEIMYAWKLLTQ